MYYNELIKQLVHTFTEESEQLKGFVQINIIYTPTQSDFIFTKKITPQVRLEARQTFPLNSETTMDRQLTSLFKTFNRVKNYK